MFFKAMKADSVDSAKTVLLVEDDPVVLSWVHAQLEESGYNLLEASNGADALLIGELHRGKIDLVVTDIVMPKINGPELVAALLKLRPDVQILYMSGYEEPFLRETTTLPPSVNYLQKPFAMTALLERITQLLESGKRTPECPVPNK